MLAALTPSEKIRCFAFLFIVLFVFVCEASIIARYVYRRIRKIEAPPERKFFVWFKRAIHLLAIFGIAAFIWGFFFEPYMLEVNSFTIETDKLTRASFRIVQISDLHTDTAERLESEIVRTVNSLSPDVVVFTGDTINEIEALPLFKKTLSEIRAPLGKFAVKGNFDDVTWRRVDLFDNTGFEVLELENVYVEKDGEKIAITGAGFWQDPAYIKCMISEAEPGLFHVFIYHTPNYAEDLENSGVDLYLCGHTHGGQVCVPCYGAIITISRYGKKYESGKFDLGKMVLYVNKGIGLEPRPAPQVRFFCKPEIAVFDIKPKK